MKSIIAAMADNRINTSDEQLQKTAEYQALMAKRDAFFESCLNQLGEQKRPMLEQLFAIDNEQSKAISRASFIRAFDLGALATIEVYVNQDKFVIPTEGDAGYSVSGAKNAGEPESLYKKLILHCLAPDEISFSGPYLQDGERILELDKEYEACVKAIFSDTQGDLSSMYKLKNELDIISATMLKLRSEHQFACGYSLGVLMITEIFQDRDRLKIY